MKYENKKEGNDQICLKDQRCLKKGVTLFIMRTILFMKIIKRLYTLIGVI